MTINGCRAVFFSASLIALLAGCSAPDDAAVPESVIGENTVGTSYLGQQKWEEAAAAFRRSLAERPEDPVLLNNLAVALLQDGKPDEAEIELRAALAADPGFPQAHFNLGLIQSNRGNFEAAAEHFEAVAAFDPDDALTQYNLGTAYASLERHTEAVAALRRALDVDPDHVSSLYALGRVLVSQGDRDEGRELIMRSQAIRARSGLDTAVGSQYGEQGYYAMGIDYPGDALAAPPPSEVVFAIAEALPAVAPKAWVVTRSAPEGGAAVIAASDAAFGRLNMRSAETAALRGHPSGGMPVAIAAGDVDNDETVELIALLDGPDVAPRIALIEQSDRGQLSWTDSAAITGTPEFPDDISSAALLLVDREHDGDLDLLVCWTPSAASSCALATNDGSGNLAMASSTAHGFDVRLGDTRTIRLTMSDFDNDRDIDLFVGGSNGLHVLSNQRDGTFASVGDEIGLGGIVVGLADFVIADLNKDGWMDVIAGAESGLSMHANERGRFDEAEQLAAHGDPVAALTVFDADNDGFLDLAVSGPRPPARIYRNAGAGRWQPMPQWLGASERMTIIAAFDGDDDGDLDLLGASAEGLALIRNDGNSGHGWISIESRGVGDNTYGVGAKIEILSGALRQKFEVTSPLPIHAGLGPRDQVDSIRHLWPSGVLQDEIQQVAGMSAKIAQLDRKGTSCPILYVWRDGRWQFVTDFLGGSAIGYQLAEGVFNTPDTDEYIKLNEPPTVDADGTVRLRVNNQLQEIIWFDQLELVAVDHPEGTELFPNERLMPQPPWPAHELYISGDIRPIVAAAGLEDGRDWKAELSAADGDYVENFSHLRFKGYADMHTLELDLGDFPDDERIVMLLDGWIDYADSSANVAASQAGLALTPPVLTVADGRGGWRETGHLMGFPAGLPKTIAVDLTGLFDSDDHRVRIRTNMRIYWDRARILVGGSDLDYVTHRLSPVSAELGYGGFPLEIGRDRRTPKSYDPAVVADVSPWNAHVGRYTTFGDVTELVSRIDDRLVTTKSGDEIELRFHAPGPVPEGSTRTYLVFADGFGKDMDPNSAANYTVGPMPFHGMPTYPYPDSISPPVDLSDTLTRTVSDSGRGWPGALPLALAPSERERADGPATRAAR